MKYSFSILLFVTLILTLFSCSKPKDVKDWVLVYEENFNETKVDTSQWQFVFHGFRTTTFNTIIKKM